MKTYLGDVKSSWCAHAGARHLRVAVGALLLSKSAAGVHLPEIPEWNSLNRKHSRLFQLIPSNQWGSKPYSLCVPRFTYPPY